MRVCVSNGVGLFWSSVSGSVESLDLHHNFCEDLYLCFCFGFLYVSLSLLIIYIHLLINCSISLRGRTGFVDDLF